MRARNLLLGIFIFWSALPVFGWTDGELLVWISKDKGYHALAGLGEKFQSAAQSGKGPDIVFWAHDLIGAWADGELLTPLKVKDELKRDLLPMSLDAVTYNNQLWGYPLALEAVSLIYNKKYVTGKPPDQLSQVPAFATELRRENPNIIPIMWDYNTPYFSWPFLASGGGYPFRKTVNGYDVTDIGVNNSGAILGLEAIVELIHIGVMPRGASYSVTERKMDAGELAMMINGPWAWANLQKSGIDFGLAPLPGVGGNPGRPFVGVLAALLNRSSPNADLAQKFIEKYVVTSEGLKTIGAEISIGVPALKTLLNETTAKDPLVKTTFENALKGVLMPNIPQMGRFWSAMSSAFQIATNGQASPEVALDEAKRSMEK